MWTIDEVVQAVGGVIVRADVKAFSGISTDSRTVGKGELFIPIDGKNFDGHAFIGDAYNKSHGGTLCEMGRKDLLAGAQGTIILVPSTMRALLDLAHFRRKKTPGTVIALTGSNGKTTTKEILVTMIGKERKVHFNERNFNNLIGVSKSILSVEGNPDFLVFELGTNSRGEIRQLAEVTEPDVSLITNINPSHLEGLDDLDGVLEEKLDLFRLTKEGGHILINVDDPSLASSAVDGNHVLHTFGINRAADFQLVVEEDLGWDGYDFTLKLYGDSMRVRSKLLGKHNLYNILAASSIAYVVGISTKQIRNAIEGFRPYAMRFKPISAKKGYTLVDDSYNANPASVKWAVTTLSSLPCSGKRIAVLGDMKELGGTTAYYHREIGRFLKESAIDEVILSGEDAREILKELNNGRGKFFGDKTTLIDYVKRRIGRGDVILVKGSRAAKMEEIVEALI